MTKTVLAIPAVFVILGSSGQVSSQNGALADAHVHLSLSGVEALERYAEAGVSVVRDCGGDFQQLSRWREEIATGKRRGPRLYLSGPMLDGPKPDARHRITIRTVSEAERAVDDLAALGVDFVKTHNALSPEAFFAILRRATYHKLRVAVHLPRGVTAWDAAEAGAGSIEHAAESLVASPIYAGIAKDAMEAIEWWKSPAGVAAIERIARTGVTIVPTLVRYEASIAAAESEDLRKGRAALMPELLVLVGRFYRAGVPILAGSDLVGFAAGPPPQTGPFREIELLEKSGLPPNIARDRASPAALASWFRKH